MTTRSPMPTHGNRSPPTRRCCTTWSRTIPSSAAAGGHHCRRPGKAPRTAKSDRCSAMITALCRASGSSHRRGQESDGPDPRQCRRDVARRCAAPIAASPAAASKRPIEPSVRSRAGNAVAVVLIALSSLFIRHDIKARVRAERRAAELNRQLDAHAIGIGSHEQGTGGLLLFGFARSPCPPCAASRSSDALRGIARRIGTAGKDHLSRICAAADRMGSSSTTC